MKLLHLPKRMKRLLHELKKAWKPGILLMSLVSLQLCLQGCGPAMTAGMLSAGGGATGAVIGYKAGKQKLHWTAGGAAAGVALGSFMNYKLEQQFQAVRQQGYDQAMNQSVRQHYWMLQNLQKTSNQTEEYTFGYYPITRPQYTLNGVTYNESTEYVLLHE